MTDELKAAVAAVDKSIADFRAANDEALKEKADRGYVDALTEQRVNALNADVDKALDAYKALTTEQASRIDAVESRIEALAVNGLGDGAGGDERAAARRFLASARGLPEADIVLGDGDLDGYRAYCQAFGQYLRRGDKMPAISAALSVGSDPDGGYWVPPTLGTTVAERLFETSPMRQLAASITIGSDAFEAPTDTNEATAGGWVGEMGSRPASATPQVGLQRIPVHEQYAMPEVTQKLLDDAAINVEAWLAGKIADKLSRVENAAFVTGDGTAKPRGFLSYGTASTTADDTARAWGILQYVPSGAAGAFAASDPGDALIDMVHKLKAAYRAGATWVMNRATAAGARKLKDGQGNYLWSANFQVGQPASLLGFPVTEAEDMPALAADSFSLAFGNFQTGYLIVDRIGVRTLRDPFTNKPYVRFYTTKRAGGDVVNFDAIKLMKFATS